MPSLGFVLPHWLYWSGLVFFPLIAWYLTRRQLRQPPDGKPTLFIAYFFLLLAGYLGIHRFYLRSAWGLMFIPAFIAILYCNDAIRDVRDDTSRTFAAMEAAKSAVDVAKPGDGASAEDRAAYERALADYK